MQDVSVPLRGMGFIWLISAMRSISTCFRPLTGHGFHQFGNKVTRLFIGFPSPYGAWVSSMQRRRFLRTSAFPSPYGAWVSSGLFGGGVVPPQVSVPLRGMGFIILFCRKSRFHGRFRPLTGHGFHRQKCICLLQHQNALLNKVPHVVLSYCSNRRIYLLRL